MRSRFAIVTGLALAVLVVSCSTSYEAKGNAAFKRAQTEKDPYKKRIGHKTAYLAYEQAVKAKPTKITDQLRARFLESTLIRANLILHEGTYLAEALPLYLNDIDSFMTPSMPSALRNGYSDLLIQIADSNLVHEYVDSAMAYLEKAIPYAMNQTVPVQKRATILTDFINNNISSAQSDYAEGTKQKNPQLLIRAEYYALLALVYDSTSTTALDLLSQCRVANLGTISGYKMVLDGKPDKRVNKYDIFMAMLKQDQSGGKLVCQVQFYNNSYNPQRMKADNFSLQDVNGKEYVATSASTFPTELLDTQRESQIKLVFPAPGAKIKRLVYRYVEHYSQKDFY